MVGDKLMNVMGKLDKKNKTNTFAIKETFCNTFAKDTDGALYTAGKRWITSHL